MSAAPRIRIMLVWVAERPMVMPVFVLKAIPAKNSITWVNHVYHQWISSLQ